MPIFPDHKLTFVHIPKNAGRSIEAALLGDAGTPDDGRRSFINRATKHLLRETRSSFAERYLIGTVDVALAAQHLTFVEMEMLGLLPSEPDFHSFAVVRNPFDRAISSVMHFSEAKWRDEADDRIRQKLFAADLAKWLERPITDHNERAHRRTQFAYLCDRHGKQAVPTVMHFESLATDFAAFMQSIGLDGLELPFRGNAGRKRNYRDYYNAEARALVQQAYGEDVDAFEYAF